MATRCRQLAIAVLLALAWSPAAAAAQQLAQADRGPKFLVLPRPGAEPVAIDLNATPVLRHRVTLSRADATLGQLLSTIQRQTGLRFIYSADVIDAGRVIGFRADSITVAAALTEILVDANVDVVFYSARQAGLVKRPPPPETGRITGTVTDSATGLGLAAAEVYLEGTTHGTFTTDLGKYFLTDIPVGSYTLEARRIGYAKLTRAVTVAADQLLVEDFALRAVASKLDEIVVTATGEQQLKELGHVVGRINADSVVKEAPITTLTELLTARVPGLQVSQGSGIVGGDVRIQIRGVNSLALNSEPIVIVDGIRYSTVRTGAGSFLRAAEPSSRLNDINPNDIATINVVKGPSAATLYGTDAANGVIVITTKRGQAGGTRWSTFVHGTRQDVPSRRYPDNYFGWSQQFGLFGSCKLQDVAAASCTQDSVTRIPNPLNRSATSILGSQHSYDYGASVSGGSSALRYYFSADGNHQMGPLRYPPALLRQLSQRLGGGKIADSQLDPNTVGGVGFRANVDAALGARGQVFVSTGYTQSDTRTFSGLDALNATTIHDPTQLYGQLFVGSVGLFQQASTEHLNRFDVSARGSFRPVGWLELHATTGLDVSVTARNSLSPRLDSILAGEVEDDRTRSVNTTANLGATATTQRGRLSFRSSIGAQYHRARSDGSAIYGSGLPPGAGTVRQAQFKIASSTFTEDATLGMYVEEVVGLKERLFLTGAVRADGATNFGTDYHAVFYPKVGVSWLASEEPFLRRLPWVTELRLRYAYGASGQQPRAEMANGRVAYVNTYANGQPVQGVQTLILPNPDIRPEKVREHEWGVDAGFLKDRVRLEATWYRRKTVDALRSIALSSGLPSQWINLGLLRDAGFELHATVQVVESNPFSLGLTLTHSWDDSRLIRVGGGQVSYSSSGGFVEGFPVGARFITPIAGFSDANGDGIITVDEVQMASRPVYAGRSNPPQADRLQGSVGLLDRRIRLSALLERSSGFTQGNDLEAGRCRNGNCLAVLDPATPLAEQARVIALGQNAPGFFGAGYFPFHKGDFTRLREVSLSLDLPMALLRPLRLDRGSLTISGRNLGLWTSFKGDPESTGLSQPSAIEGGFAGPSIPQSRSWSARIDLDF